MNGSSFSNMADCAKLESGLCELEVVANVVRTLDQEVSPSSGVNGHGIKVTSVLTSGGFLPVQANQ